MGEIVKITCKSCRTEWQCNVGCGMAHALLENVRQVFSEEIQEEIDRKSVQTEYPIFSFAYEPAYCIQCGGIVGVPVLSFPEENAEFCGCCEKCGQKTIILDNLKDMECPKCHEKELEMQKIGLWD